MMLKPEESELLGKWISVNGQIRADETCERIQWLTAHYLRRVAVSKQWGEWETLFEDPNDGRFWERTFPQGDLQGGGPPRLAVLGKHEARNKYQRS